MNTPLASNQQLRAWLEAYLAMMEANLGALSESKVEGLYRDVVDRIIDVRAYLRVTAEPNELDPPSGIQGLHEGRHGARFEPRSSSETTCVGCAHGWHRQPNYPDSSKHVHCPPHFIDCTAVKTGCSE